MNEFIADFIHMGGYGLYVWLVYGMLLLVLLINIIMPLWRHHQILSRLLRQKQRLERSHHASHS